VQYSTCCVENKCDAIIQKEKALQINACWSGAFPAMIEELDDQDWLGQTKVDGSKTWHSLPK
jgi:hypothetical protein